MLWASAMLDLIQRRNWGREVGAWKTLPFGSAGAEGRKEREYERICNFSKVETPRLVRRNLVENRRKGENLLPKDPPFLCSVISCRSRHSFVLSARCYWWFDAKLKHGWDWEEEQKHPRRAEATVIEADGTAGTTSGTEGVLRNRVKCRKERSISKNFPQIDLLTLSQTTQIGSSTRPEGL